MRVLLFVWSACLTYFNTLRPRQNGRHFTDDVFKCISWMKMYEIFSLKFVPEVPFNITPALVKIMAGRRSGDKPLSEPMMVSLLTHTCVTQPPLLWRHNERDNVSNHQRFYCLLNRLFRRRSKITSKLRVTGLCVWNSPVTGEFPAQRASNAENVSIWRRHHAVS